jgi:hypothetical protein
MAYLTDETVHDMARGIQARDNWIASQKKKLRDREHEARAIIGVAAGTLAFSYADAAYSDDGTEWKLFGVPVSAAAALGLHALGWTGYAGKYSNDVHNLATGALANWISQFGRDWGRKARSKPAHHGVAGYGAGALPQPGQRYAVDPAAYAAYGN